MNDDGFGVEADSAVLFSRYKLQCRDRSIVPMTWGEWLRAGMPTFDDEDAAEK